MADQQPTARGDERCPATKDLILELNFVPDWARQPADQTVVEKTGREEKRPSGGRRDRDDRQRRGPRGRRDGDGRGQRPPRDRRGEQRGAPPRRGGQDRGRPRRDAVAPAPVKVRLLPEQHNLATIVRKISTSRRAYPLVNIAYLFLDNPKACDVRIEPDDGQKDLTLYQCKTCRMVTLSEPTLNEHIVDAHLDEYFEIEEIEGDPPSGDFPCVCRCGLSGELLGPPNHHTYAERLQELHRSRYPTMPIERYREKIDILHDPEAVEQWKQAARKETRYTPKEPIEGVEPQSKRSQATAYMRQHVVPRASRKTRRAALPLSVAKQMPDEALKRSLFEALSRENRFPLSLLFAMRAAFRHMHLHVFKTGRERGAHFVCANEPSPLDPDHVVEAIRAVILYLHDNPGCTRRQLLDALCPGNSEDDPASREILSHLSWLIEKGHVLEFFNGTLSVPLPGRRD